MFTDDHLFVLLVKLCYGKPILVDAYRRAQIPLLFSLFLVDAKTGEGNDDGLRRVGRSNLTLGANESQFGVAVPFTTFIFHSLFIEVTIFITFTEYQYAGTYMIAIAILLFFFLGFVASFCTNRQPCAYARITLEERKKTGKVFIITLRSGAVMGFPLAANGLLVLFIAFNLFKLYHDDNWRDLFELTTEYGFGGSSMALIDRVGGDIYPKAATVGANDVGKFIKNILKYNSRNPAFIANKVGNNIGGIAGNCGSYAMPSNATLIVASIPSIGVSYDLTILMYTPLASFVDMLVYLLTTLFVTDFYEIKAVEEIKLTLKSKWDISTALITVGITLATWVFLPSFLTFFNFGTQKGVKN
ncbi:hypothetical protein Nepgr_032584 [Nepenthes gracilis]|uniref:H(+)-exporting diphosphatase n=1 Tax=Nepenthes gracilis TaxID=150966 RepID=A0AAD3TKI6_NEPGR|nr:hypothetical protein Nepgr_032584 [Nepenthes gracilis]